MTPSQSLQKKCLLLRILVILLLGRPTTAYGRSREARVYGRDSVDTMRAADSRVYDGTRLADTEHERFFFTTVLTRATVMCPQIRVRSSTALTQHRVVHSDVPPAMRP